MQAQGVLEMISLPILLMANKPDFMRTQPLGMVQGSLFIIVDRHFQTRHRQTRFAAFLATASSCWSKVFLKQAITSKFLFQTPVLMQAREQEETTLVL